jgi:septal ring factor EnvC (AmiA/AmiB activator)
MPANDTQLQKLELLEARIAAAVQRLGELNEQCRTLSEKNQKIESELAEFKTNNSELEQQIVQLKADKAKAPKRSMDDKKILNRIDRMLEKFGELQI